MSELRRPYTLAGFLVVLCLVSLRVFGGGTDVQPDSGRYVVMGLNLEHHGVISGEDAFRIDAAPKPGLGMGGVFTTFEIALAARLDDQTKDTFVCLATNPQWRTCEVRIVALKVFYVFEVFLFHVCIFLIARLVFQNDIKAWLAVILSMSFKETKNYVDSILTEPSYMMALGVFLLLWIIAWRDPEKIKFWFWCGVSLGVMALIKPAWNAMSPILIVFSIAVIALRRDVAPNVLRAGLPFVGGVLIVTLPLFVRNVVQLDLWALSDPYYLVASLSHRFAFNAMSWGEWAAGWIYYLPDFGDKAARALFGVERVDKLDWGPDSYYVYGRDVMHALALQHGSLEKAKSYLFSTYFFNDPVKSIAVTALLAWRGIFVGSLFGLAAMVLAGPVLYFANQQVRRDILVLAAPLVMMLGVHALVSVNIYRYNLGLIVPFSLILSQVLYALGHNGYKRGLSFVQTLR